MTTPYNVRYSMPNPILAQGQTSFWMVKAGFLAVVSINDQDAFATKSGTDDLNAAFNKWVPMVAMTAYNDISEAASRTADPSVLLAQRDELASVVEGKVAKMSESWGLNVQDIQFETFERPSDEAVRLREMGFVRR